MKANRQMKRAELFTAVETYLRSISQLVPIALGLWIKIEEWDDHDKFIEADVLLRAAFQLREQALNQVLISSDLSGEPEDWIVEEWIQHIMTNEGQVDWEWLQQLKPADIAAGEQLVKQAADLLDEITAISG